MQLGPKDEERLLIFLTAELARRTLERGHRLNAPEAIALVCDEMHMVARAGGRFDEVAQAGRAALGADRLMDGVADLVPEIRSRCCSKRARGWWSSAIPSAHPHPEVPARCGPCRATWS